MKVSSFLFAATLCIGGCATITGPTEAQREGARLLAATNDVFRGFADCIQQVEAKPQYAPLYQKLAIGKVPPTALQIADPEIVADSLIPLGFDWYAELQGCNQTAMERFYAIDPEFGAVSAGWYKEVTRIMLIAVTPQASYGQVNSEIRNYWERRKTDITTTQAAVRARLNAKHQAEVQQRARDNATRSEFLQGIAEAFSLAILALAQQQNSMAQAQRQYIDTHPAYVPQKRITRTTCQRLAYTIQCESY